MVEWLVSFASEECARLARTKYRRYQSLRPNTLRLPSRHSKEVTASPPYSYQPVLPFLLILCKML